MANRFFISMEEGLQEPEWISRVEPYMNLVINEIGYDDEEVSIMFCSDPFIQSLNKQYREIDNPTDVLSFENGEEYTDEDGEKWFSAGDIIISLDTLPKNAEYFGVSANDELKRLLLHGLLHLNGYDHGDEHVESGIEPKDEMLALQEKTLKKFAEYKII
jgi:probable rRNA maturation factor